MGLFVCRAGIGERGNEFGIGHLARRNGAMQSGFEGLEVDGFCEVFGEPGGEAEGTVVVGAEAGEGDAGDGDGTLGAELPHEVEAGAVGQADVAEDEVEGFKAGDREGLGDAAGGVHSMASAAEQAFENVAGLRASSTSKIFMGRWGVPLTGFGGMEGVEMGLASVLGRSRVKVVPSPEP